MTELEDIFVAVMMAWQDCFDATLEFFEPTPPPLPRRRSWETLIDMGACA